jgi:hypothetical protein
MIQDYINKEAVSKMTFEEFKECLGNNIEIARHKLTVKEAFIELGGTFKKEVKKSGRGRIVLFFLLMKDFERLLNNLNKLDIDDIFFSLWKDSKVQSYIIELNTEGESTSQLYELGEDSLGRSLGNYSPFTIDAKLFGGGDSRIDHITLKDTGEFYESFKVKPLKTGFKITANPNKDDDNLFQIYGEDIVGLNEDNTELLLAFIEKDFEKELEKRLFK